MYVIVRDNFYANKLLMMMMIYLLLHTSISGEYHS
jgi:hypothetical protein